MSVSLCMIVRDAERTLHRCLSSVAGLFQEVVVIDTGSVDRTVAIARGAGANVCTYPWQDDFAAARNESLRQATGSWVFWMDADEYLNRLNKDRLAGLFASLSTERVTYVITQLNILITPADAPLRQMSGVRQPRLWRRLPEVRWEGRVHEQILPALQQRGDRIVKVPHYYILHDGYATVAQCQHKLSRNIRLSGIEVDEQPGRAEAWFFLGRSLLAVDLGRARAALQEAIRLASPADGWVAYAQQLLDGIGAGVSSVEA